MHTFTYTLFLPAGDDISEDSTRVFSMGRNTWTVKDARLAQMSLNTDWEYYDAIDRFLKVLGVFHVVAEYFMLLLPSRSLFTLRRSSPLETFHSLDE